MSTFLDQHKANQLAYSQSPTAKTTEIENHILDVQAVAPVKDKPEQLMLVTSEGTFFTFKNAFTGIPFPEKLGNKFTAEFSLTKRTKEGKEYINIISVDVDSDSVPKLKYVAASAIVVSL